MPEERFELRFRGETTAGRDPREVQEHIAKIFHLAPAQADRLFSGQECVLKRGLSATRAAEYEQAFRQAGALCELRAEAPPVPRAFPLDFAPELSSPGPASAKALTQANPAATSAASPAATMAIPRSLVDAAVKAAATMTCPKCGLVQPAEESCAACGVIIAKATARLENKAQALESRAALDMEATAAISTSLSPTSAPAQVAAVLPSAQTATASSATTSTVVSTTTPPPPQAEAKPKTGGVFAPEKKGIEKGMTGGIVMMVIAAVWFFVGLKMDLIFFYPPVLFAIGLYAFFKGLVTGNVSGHDDATEGNNSPN